MTHSLPSNPSLGLLKKQAKKLLKQFRGGNSDALEAVETYHPRPASFTGLRDAQLVIARGYGFSGWSSLCEAVEFALDAENSLPDKVALFIQLGCVQYNGSDTVRNYQRARRLLASSPEISGFSFYSAVVANNVAAVSRYLESDPALALTSGGPLAWPPLLYSTYSRIDEAEDTQHSLSIVKLLLEHGADPDSCVLLNDTYRFTALTGAMGEGEQGVNQPPHQYADELVTLLLEAGASPNEGQGLYNTMFTDSADKWLQVLINKGLKADDLLNWDSTDRDVQVTTLDYQLSCAVDSGRLARVKLLLEAGANPDVCSTYNGRAVHTNALLAGHTEIRKLLEVEGVIPEELGINDQFALACVREDDAAIVTLLESHPGLNKESILLHAAAENSSMRIVELLLKSGFDVNGLSTHGRTLLHYFALSNDAEKIRNLLTLGARTDIKDTSHQSTAAGFAAYSGSYDAMRSLLDASDSLLEVVSCAYVERAKIILEKIPDAIHQRSEPGNTVMHVVGCWLHDEPDYDTCNSMVELLLSAGADINAKNKQGQTPIEFNLASGSETLAEALSEHL